MIRFKTADDKYCDWLLGQWGVKAELTPHETGLYVSASYTGSYIFIESSRNSAFDLVIKLKHHQVWIDGSELHVPASSRRDYETSELGWDPLR